MKTCQTLILLAGFLLLMTPAASSRTWTSADGRKLEADFVSATEDSVTIRTKNGKSFTLKFDKISAADREFVKAKLAETAAAEKDEDEAEDEDGEPGKSTGKYDDKTTGKWESGKHEQLDYRFYAERKLRRSKTKKYPLVI